VATGDGHNTYPSDLSNPKDHAVAVSRPAATPKITTCGRSTRGMAPEMGSSPDVGSGTAGRGYVVSGTRVGPPESLVRPHPATVGPRDGERDLAHRLARSGTLPTASFAGEPVTFRAVAAPAGCHWTSEPLGDLRDLAERLDAGYGSFMAATVSCRAR